MITRILVKMDRNGVQEMEVEGDDAEEVKETVNDLLESLAGLVPKEGSPK